MIPTSLRRAWGQGRAARVPVETIPADPISALAGTAPTPANWQTDVLFVCLSCSAKLADGLAPDGRTRLRQWFKARLGSAGRSKALRVVETSCLGLCPEQRIAVAIGRELAAEPAIIRSVATEAEREAVYRAAVGDQPGPKL